MGISLPWVTLDPWVVARTHPLKYVGLVKRSRRRPVNKLQEFSKASWLMSNGYPPLWVAQRIGVSRTTLWSWRKLMNHDHAFKQLRRQALLLPEHLRDQLAAALDRRAA